MLAKQEQSAQAVPFELFSHSIKGKQHLQEGLPCQDAFASCVSPQGYMVMALADGVSQSPASEVASKKAVEAICDYWSGVTLKYPEPADIKCLMKTAFNYAAGQSRSDEKEHPLPMGYETTLLVCFLIPERFLFTMWCGDGGGYVLYSGGKLEPISQIQRSSDGSVVTLCAGPDYWKCRILDAKDINTILMVTDGINDVILRSDNPMQMTKSLMGLTNGKGVFSNQVENRMQEEPFEAVQDDITIAILVSRSHESMEMAEMPESNERDVTKGKTLRVKSPEKPRHEQRQPRRRILGYLRTLCKKDN